MIRLNSSLRERAPSATLSLARTMAADLGISRVTDITRLDSIGIPVFTSVRPSAMVGSLCVNAGKGVAPIEAQVGAFMEAIEFAVAEPGTASVAIELLTARHVLDGMRRPDAILDFCPIVQHQVDPDAPLACVTALDVVSGQRTYVPAELVFLPYVGHPGTGHFGSSSNGLASGNTREEAMLHGLLELIERDIRSFQRVFPSWQIVDSSTLPATARTLVAQIAQAGLQLCVRSCASPFGLPFFEASLYDPYARAAQYFNGGYGCHLMSDVALIRAITEAVQSRLSWIHGGRDDLEELAAYVARHDPEEVARESAAHFARVSNGETVSFAALPDATAEAGTVAAALSHTIARLLAVGVRHVCCVSLTSSTAPLQVVRVIVPRLEYLDGGSHRVGPRLRDALRSRGARSA